MAKHARHLGGGGAAVQPTPRRARPARRPPRDPLLLAPVPGRLVAQRQVVRRLRWATAPPRVRMSICCWASWSKSRRMVAVETSSARGRLLDVEPAVRWASSSSIAFQRS